MAQLVIGVKYKTDIAVTTQSNLPLSRAFRRRPLAIASDSFALLRFTLVSRAFHCFDVLYWLFFVATRFGSTIWSCFWLRVALWLAFSLLRVFGSTIWFCFRLRVVLRLAFFFLSAILFATFNLSRS